MSALSRQERKSPFTQRVKQPSAWRVAECIFPASSSAYRTSTGKQPRQFLKSTSSLATRVPSLRPLIGLPDALRCFTIRPMTNTSTKETSRPRPDPGSDVIETSPRDAAALGILLDADGDAAGRLADGAPERRRRVRAPVATRQRLILAAMEVIAERGFDEARSDDIVKRAGLSNGALYAHFKNKNELLLTAFAEQTFFLQDTISEIDSSDLDEISKLLRLMRSHPVMHLKESIVGETLAKARRDAGIRAVWLQQLERIESTYSHWIRSGQEKGLIRRDVQPEVVARLISSAGTGYQVLSEISAPAVADHSWISGLCRLVESLRT